MLSVKDINVYRARLKHTSLAEIIYRSKELCHLFGAAHQRSIFLTF
jgi:hypothetical protein